MSEMFRCPGCKEAPRTGQPVCQYCDSSIDVPTAHAAALKFQAGIDACAAANRIKSLNYAAPVMLLLDAALLFLWSDDEFFSSTRMRIGISIRRLLHLDSEPPVLQTLMDQLTPPLERFGIGQGMSDPG